MPKPLSTALPNKQSSKSNGSIEWHLNGRIHLMTTPPLPKVPIWPRSAPAETGCCGGRPRGWPGGFTARPPPPAPHAPPVASSEPTAERERSAASPVPPCVPAPRRSRATAAWSNLTTPNADVARARRGRGGGAAARLVPSFGFRVQGAGCRVQGSGCRVQDAGCRVQGAGCRVQGAGCRVQGEVFGRQRSALRVEGWGFDMNRG